MNVGNQVKWDFKILSLRDYIADWQPKIDCNPLHQRMNVENIGQEKAHRAKYSKRQSIIESILLGYDIGEIKINVRTDEERLKWGLPLESIDGGHRKRTIADFINNKFRTNGKGKYKYMTFGELPEEVQQLVLNFRIRLVIYVHLTPEQKYFTWKFTNTTTPVNHQEGLNGYGDHPVANLVRETARFIGGSKPNEIHHLFAIKENVEGKVIGERLSFDPDRLTYDRLVARMVCVALYGKGRGATACDDEEIESMYADKTITPDRLKTAKDSVYRWLNFISDWAATKKSVMRSKLTLDEFIMLFRLVVDYESRYGKYNAGRTGFKIIQWEEFYKLSAQSLAQFFAKEPSDYGKEVITSRGGKPYFRYQEFTSYLRTHADVRLWKNTVEWFEHNYMVPHELIANNILLVLDGKGSYSAAERSFGIVKQGFKDSQGKPLNMENSHAGHRKPRAKGGKTTMDNLVVQTAEENLELGARDYDTFMAGIANKKQQ